LVNEEWPLLSSVADASLVRGAVSSEESLLASRTGADRRCLF
jgi:hypothetical protein